MTHTVKPTVNIFFVRDDKVLLGRRANTGWMDGHLCPPGGHIEKGETPTAAALREVQEELGAEIEPEDLEFICVAARNPGATEHVAYEFVVRGNHVVRNNEPEKCSELVWADINDLPKDLIEDFRVVIQQAIQGNKKFLEIGY